jgi:hypothetical protein
MEIHDVAVSADSEFAQSCLRPTRYRGEQSASKDGHDASFPQSAAARLLAMPRAPRSHVEDLRGATELAVKAVAGVTELVEAVHLAVAGGPPVVGRPLAGIAKLFTAPVYGGIKAVTRVAGAGIDAALERLAPALGAAVPGADREALLAALNGVLGDYLAETKNRLAIEMALHPASPPAGDKALLLVHGSSMNDLQWKRNGHEHGAALARDLGYLPVYLHYNTGLHVSTNGRALAALLEDLVTSWPQPISELSIVAHSMGGLVARSACHAGDEAGHLWRRALRKMIFLGTPHHGASLERAGTFIHLLLGATPYSSPFARLARIRSAGVTDLRFGYVLDEHWHGRDRFAVGRDPRNALELPAGVDCYAVAGTTASGPGSRLPGDGLVSVGSALGQHGKPELSLPFPEGHRFIAYATSHLDLLSSPTVYAAMRSWLQQQGR